MFFDLSRICTFFTQNSFNFGVIFRLVGNDSLRPRLMQIRFFCKCSIRLIIGQWIMNNAFWCIDLHGLLNLSNFGDFWNTESSDRNSSDSVDADSILNQFHARSIHMCNFFRRLFRKGLLFTFVLTSELFLV